MTDPRTLSHRRHRPVELVWCALCDRFIAGDAFKQEHHDFKVHASASRYLEGSQIWDLRAS